MKRMVLFRLDLENSSSESPCHLSVGIEASFTPPPETWLTHRFDDLAEYFGSSQMKSPTLYDLLFVHAMEFLFPIKPVAGNLG